MKDNSKRFDFYRDAANGCLVGPDGCHYDNEAEAMYYSSFAACGCGCPELIHKLIVDCAKKFDGEHPKPGVSAIQKIVEERPEVVAEFIAHYLDASELTEHGSSVYGSWLTERGRQFVEIGPMEER